jgi:hypothetical protein
MSKQFSNVVACRRKLTKVLACQEVFLVVEPGAQPDTISLRHVAVVFVADPFQDDEGGGVEPADMMIPAIGLAEFSRALGRLKWETVVAESVMDEEDLAKEVVSAADFTAFGRMHFEQEMFPNDVAKWYGAVLAHAAVYFPRGGA